MKLFKIVYPFTLLSFLVGCQSQKPKIDVWIFGSYFHNDSIVEGWIGIDNERIVHVGSEPNQPSKDTILFKNQFIYPIGCQLA